MSDESLLLEALNPPISRSIWDSVIKCNDIQLLLLTLTERQESRKSGKDWIPHPAEINGPIKTVYNNYNKIRRRKKEMNEFYFSGQIS